MGKNRPFSKEDRQMANKHIKICATPSRIREMCPRTTMRYYYTSMGIAKIKNCDNTGSYQGS